jgi:hypothetical protein
MEYSTGSSTNLLHERARGRSDAGCPLEQIEHRPFRSQQLRELSLDDADPSPSSDEIALFFMPIHRAAAGRSHGLGKCQTCYNTTGPVLERAGGLGSRYDCYDGGDVDLAVFGQGGRGDPL